MESTDLYPDLKTAAQAFTAQSTRMAQLEDEERTVGRNRGSWLISGGLELGLVSAGQRLSMDAIKRHGGRITPQGVVDRDGRAV